MAKCKKLWPITTKFRVQMARQKRIFLVQQRDGLHWNIDHTMHAGSSTSWENPQYNPVDSSNWDKRRSANWKEFSPKSRNWRNFPALVTWPPAPRSPCPYLSGFVLFYSRACWNVPSPGQGRCSWILNIPLGIFFWQLPSRR